MTPSQLSDELRNGKSADLTRRRWVVGLSLAGATLGGIVSLFQTGIIHHLPDPPLPGFDSARVDASDYGYRRLATPDALMMVASYAGTAWLAGAGGKDRAKDKRALPIATAAKTVTDVAVNLRLAREEWSENKALCAYCQMATLFSVASVALSLPEAMRAIRGQGSR